MAGFANMGDLGNAPDDGRVHFSSFRKVPSQQVTAGEWMDLTLAAGNPVPQYYASSPLAAATLDGTRGIFHGDDKSPSAKFLTAFGMTTGANTVGHYTLCDFVLYYPFVDLDDTSSPQAMTNTTTLPRYTSGDGLRIIATCVAPTTGGGSYRITYVNQSGVEQTTRTITMPSTVCQIATLIGSVPANAGTLGGPYLPLNAGDTGVRSIVSVEVLSAGGGLAAFALVRPLADMVIREVNVSHEVTFYGRGTPRPVRIYDGAYLGLIGRPSISINGSTLAGYIQTAWN